MKTEIAVRNVNLQGELKIPVGASVLIIFVSGGESSIVARQNILIEKEFYKFGFATLLLRFLSDDEGKRGSVVKWDIDVLTERLIGVTRWCIEQDTTKCLKIGYFGASVGSAVVLSAATYWGTKIGAVVSRGGRPDLVMEELDLIEAPVMLIVGGEDSEGINMNRKAYIKIGCTKKLEIVSGATHLFEEDNAIEKVADIAKKWFGRFLLEDGVK
ncbi:MAG TPA: dienelactone hydrolase family protein [Spirochaetia bacterium]|nr:dienelactone hydrolase family protein [Spirochaetia bacterium]